MSQYKGWTSIVAPCFKFMKTTITVASGPILGAHLNRDVYFFNLYFMFYFFLNLHLIGRRVDNQAGIIRKTQFERKVLGDFFRVIFLISVWNLGVPRS